MTNGASILWEATLKPEFSSFALLAEQIELVIDDMKLALNATLACDEAFTNIVMYSEATVVRAKIVEHGHQLMVILADDGKPFDPVSAKPIVRRLEDLDKGGMGIKLIKKVCENVEYAYADGMNVLTLYLAR